MMVPTVHLNGTSKAELVRQLREAHQATVKALEALGGAHPNARDYYPQGPDAIKVAFDEHRARVAKLLSVCDEIFAISEAIELGSSRRE
jgi:hypothetical protein